MDRRLGRGAFFAVWILLLGGQLAALANQAASEDGPGLQLPVVLAIVGLLQLLKLPITAWRLNDIGRPASDAIFFVLLPVANIIGLMRFMIEATPSEKAWVARRRGWSSQIGPIQALGQALPLIGKSAAVGIPMVLFYGLVMAGVGQYVLEFAEDAATMDPASRSTLAQVFTVLAVFLGLYTAVQFTKRSKATRISWFPSLFFAPALLVAGSLSFFEAGMQSNLQLILLTFIYMAWQMIWMSIGGAALMVAVTLAAERVRKGEALEAGQIFAQVGPRTLDVAGPHGTRVQAVTIGMQVIIPGIFYMLQLAFADAIAVLKPDAAALKESGQLTWGMRQRLFKLFLATTLATMIFHFGLVTALDGVDKALAYFIDPRNMSFGAFALGEVVWAVYAWILQIALLLMYHDRVRYLEERRAERRAAKAALGGDAAPPDASAGLSAVEAKAMANLEERLRAALPEEAEPRSEGWILVEDDDAADLEARIREYFELDGGETRIPVVAKLLKVEGGIAIQFPLGIPAYNFTNLVGWIDNGREITTGFVTSPESGRRYALYPDPGNDLGDTLIGTDELGKPVEVYLPENQLRETDEARRIDEPPLDTTHVLTAIQADVVVEAGFGNPRFVQ